MTFNSHSGLTGTNLHEAFHYTGSSDPGTVGANKYWLDTSAEPYILKRRNSANDGWVTIGASGSFSGTAYDVPFDPTTPGDWGGTPPDNVGDALDYLAANTGGSGGGNVVTIGAYGDARPSSPNPGDTSMPVDGFFIEMWNGDTWHPHWNGRRLLKPPPASSWTTENLGSGAFVDDRGTVLLSQPSGPSGPPVAMAYFGIPASAFSMIALIEFDWPDGPYINAGVLLHKSTEDPFMLFGRMQSPGSELLLALYSDDTSFNLFWGSPVVNAIYAPVPPMRIWLKVVNDGTHLTYSYCLTPDGTTWHDYVISDPDDPIEPDQVGIGLRNDNNVTTTTAYVRVLSWELYDIS